MRFLLREKNKSIFFFVKESLYEPLIFLLLLLLFFFQFCTSLCRGLLIEEYWGGLAHRRRPTIRSNHVNLVCFFFFYFLLLDHLSYFVFYICFSYLSSTKWSCFYCIYMLCRSKCARLSTACSFILKIEKDDHYGHPKWEEPYKQSQP